MEQTDLHPMLARQLKKSRLSLEESGDEEFISLVNTAYFESDNERRMTDNSVKLMSEEMFALNSQLREQADEIKAIIQSVTDGIMVIDIYGQILSSNQAAEDIFKYSSPELKKLKFFDLFQNFDSAEILTNDSLDKAKISEFFHRPFEIETQTSTNKKFVCEISLKAVTQNQNTPFTLIVHDITYRKEQEKKLYEAAFYDSLTGLPNRSLFIDRLKEHIKKMRRLGPTKAALLFIDLDRFKVINDSLGHQAGDELIIQVAQRFQKTLRPYDTVARLGGDEFTILLTELEEVEHAKEIAQRHVEEILKPFTVMDREIFISASIGIYMIQPDDVMSDDILRNADLAMYHAKNQGRGRWEIFDSTQHDKMLDVLHLETDLRSAIKKKQIFVYYQPIIDIKHGNIRGFEALIRWFHPERGMISPGEFIPLAEETGLIFDLGRFVFDSVCKQLTNWNQSLSEKQRIDVAVNLSVREIMDDGAFSRLMKTLKKHKNIAPHLKFEITESTIMKDPELVGVRLTELKKYKSCLSIDDFGTGYSALEYLHRFPIDILKIDRTFVSNMTTNHKDYQLVRGVISLSHDLGLKVVAEGVETQDELDSLRELKADFAQGYYFARPLNVIEATSILLTGGVYPMSTQQTGKSVVQKNTKKVSTKISQ